MVKMLKLFMAVLLFSACSPKDDSENKLSKLIFDNGEKTVVFEVEEAKTPDEMKQGLMFRDSIPENGGMIFEIGTPRSVAMWMKDTKIPLDIVFVNAANEVSGFIENAEPLSETIMPAPEPAVVVIELNGGSIKKHDIQIGDTVRHEFLQNMPKAEK